MQNNFLLTPKIARRLLDSYEQFKKFAKDEVDGLTLDQFQKLLASYGALYFNTNDVAAILSKLEDLSLSREQILPTAAVPNADQLKRLVEEHEKLVQQKAAQGPNVTRQWIEQQSALVEKRLEEVEAAEKVVFEAQKEPVRLTQGEPILAGAREEIATTSVSTYPSQPPHPFPNRPEKPATDPAVWAKEQRINNLETILAETDIPQIFRRTTAEQLDQVLNLAQAEGIPLNQDKLKERIFTIVTRTTSQPPTQDVVNLVAERIPASRLSAPDTMPSAFDDTPRPYRPRIPEPKPEAETKPKPSPKITSAQQTLYLALRGEPYWRQLSHQLSPLNWFGRGTDTSQQNLQAIQTAIQSLRAQTGSAYARDMPIFLALEQRVDYLIEAGKTIEAAELFTPENAEGVLERIDETADKIYQLDLNVQTQSLETRPVGKREIVDSLPKETQERLENRQFNTQRVLIEAGGLTRRAQQNLFSTLGIKLRQLFTNPRLGFLRWSLSAGFLGASTILPAPLAIASVGAGVSLALAQLKHAGGILKNVATLAAKIAGVSLGPIGAAAATALNFAEPLLKAAKWIFIGFFAILAFLVIFTITLFHGLFLKESTSVGVVPESKYIELAKIAEPATLANSDLPRKINYTIKVGAKEKNLKNIRVEDTFSAYGKGSVSTPTASSHSFPNTLTVGSPVIITYSIDLGSDYQDAVVVNNIRIIADVEDGPSGESVTRTATVIIGSPPTGCFTFTMGGGKAWSDGDKALIASVIAKMAQYRTYMTNLCRGGPIRVLRGSVADEGESGHVIGKSIYLFDRAFNGSDQLFYTLSHESGHVFAKVDGGVSLIQFAKSSVTQTEGVLPTYPRKYLSGSNNVDEDFAETIALYIIRKEVKNLSGLNIGNLQGLWPLHYQYARNNLFGQQD